MGPSNVGSVVVKVLEMRDWRCSTGICAVSQSSTVDR